MLKQSFFSDTHVYSLAFFKQLFDHIETTASADGSNVVASFDEMRTNGLHWVMADFKIVFIDAVSFSNSYTLATFPTEANSLYAIRAHNFYNEDGKMVAQSFTRWVTMQINTRTLGRIPSYIIDREYEREADALPYEKLRCRKISDYQKLKSFYIQAKDVDQNEHTNNTVYMLKCIEMALDCGFDLRFIKVFSIQFKHETRLQDKLQIRIEGNSQVCNLNIVDESTQVDVSLAEIQCA